MSSTENDQSTIICHQCGTEYLPSYADAPLCPNCDAVHVRSGSKAKVKNTDAAQFSQLAPENFKIKSLPHGVQLSWRPSSALITLLISFFLLTIVLLIVFPIAQEGMNDFSLTMLILVFAPTAFILFRMVVNRRYLTLTDLAIADEIKLFAYPHKREVSHSISFKKSQFMKIANRA